MNRKSELRQEKVRAGLCAFCGQKRGQFRFLCDACAKKHRERQRNNLPNPVVPVFPNTTKRDHLLAWIKEKRGMA